MSASNTKFCIGIGLLNEFSSYDWEGTPIVPYNPVPYGAAGDASVEYTPPVFVDILDGEPVTEKANVVYEFNIIGCRRLRSSICCLITTPVVTLVRAGT